jgi:prephenate dehydratase
MEFDSIGQFEKVVDEIKPHTDSLKILGVYKKGKLI